MEPEELDVETNQRFNRIGAAAPKTILILLAVLAVYFVLYPIVVWCCMRIGVMEVGGPTDSWTQSERPLIGCLKIARLTLS